MVEEKGAAPRRRARLLSAGAVVAVPVLAVGALAWTGRVDVPFAGDNEPGVFKVGEKGGTYSLPSGGRVTVPEGAVDGEATLTVTAPRTLQPGDAAPLQGVRQGGIAFDVSLSRGHVRGVQPKKPLELELPIEGAPKPQGGAEDVFALPYTALPGGKYLLLPAKAAGAGKLAVRLPHLSPKYVAYVSDEALLDAFDPAPVEQDRDACDETLTAGGVKVKIDHGKSRGWSRKDDSAIFACLAESKENPGRYVRLNVLNRIDYLLSVASTSNVRLAASRGDTETEVIKALSRTIFNRPKVKEYVAEGGKLVGSIDAQALYGADAVVELQADPHTFLAEGVWRALNVVSAVFIGEGADEAAKAAKGLVEAVNVVSCLEDAVGEHKGDLTSAGLAVDVVIGCTGPIVEHLAKHIKAFDLWNRVKTVWDLGGQLKTTLERAWNGIRLTLADTLRVTVVAEAPSCPSGAELHRIVQAGANRPAAGTPTRTRGESAECTGLWGRGKAVIAGQGSEPDIPITFIIRFQDGEWRTLDEGQDYCAMNDLPAPVRDQWLGC